MTWAAALSLLNRLLGILPAALAYLAGRRAVQAEVMDDALDAAKTRLSVEDQVRRMDGTAAVNELRRDFRRP